MLESVESSSATKSFWSRNGASWALRVMTRLFAILLVTMMTLSALWPTTASARARCGAYTTREYRAEIDPATAIFVGELIGSTPRVRSGVQVGVDVEFRVVQAIRGVAVGDTIALHWRLPAPDGARAGGCSVPVFGDGFATRILVIAQGPEDALTVANDSTSQRVDRRSALVRRVRRMARRR